MKTGHDINQINGSGYIILPLSMSRLSSGQSPEECYKVFEYFLDKFKEYSNDVVLLYTSSIYMNAEEVSHRRRRKIRQQALNHSTALRSMIDKNKDFMPKAFHYLPSDYIVLNSKHFGDYLGKLKNLEGNDETFQEKLKRDAQGREYNQANISFLLEEIVITHILRQKLVELPQTLSQDDWRLIVYPGEYLKTDLHQWKQGILPKGESKNEFAGMHYNFNQKALSIFGEIS